MIVPCPKCGGESTDTGSKYVCGDCYWVFDKGAQVTQAGVMTPRGSSKESTALIPPMQTGPTICPKCSGKLLDISGKLVCDDCYHVVDTPSGKGGRAKSGPSVQPVATQAPSNQAPRPAAPQPGLSQPGQFQPSPNQAAQAQPAPSVAFPTACPKCNGKLVAIGGKPVCETCFHVADEPMPATASPQPSAIPGAPANAQPAPQWSGPPQDPTVNPVQPNQSQSLSSSAAPHPMQPPTAPGAAVPTVCPKCSGKLVNLAGAYVCETCYHSIDIPGATPAPGAAPAGAPGAAPTPAATGAPTGSGPASSPAQLRPAPSAAPLNNFPTPTPTPPTGLNRNSFQTQPVEGEMSPAMIGGVMLILMLILMIAFLAIKH